MAGRPKSRGQQKDGLLTRTGKLRKKFLPAVYFDTSVLIDYWLANGYDQPESEELPPGQKLPNQPWEVYREILDQVFRSDKRLHEVFEIRKQCEGFPTNSTPTYEGYRAPNLTQVTSPLAILEMEGWYASTVLRQSVSAEVGVRFIEWSSTKELGEHIRKIWDLRTNETQKGSRPRKLTGPQLVIGRLLLSPSYLDSHGLRGINVADILGFNLTYANAWEESSFYSLVQVGAADVVHIRFAQHLGCTFFASFDGDFKRIADVVEQETGITILRNPKELIRALRG